MLLLANNVLLWFFVQFFLLPSHPPVSAAPSLASAQQSQSKGPVPGQIFSGDQLPNELKSAPIVQPSPPFVSSFSGYSFNYSPTGNHQQQQQRPSVEQPTNTNGYDFSSSVMGSAATSATSNAPPPSRDAFVLRPAPSEQFLPVLPPPSVPQQSADLAKFLPPPNSQRPKLTGWVMGVHEPPAGQRPPFPGGQAVVNPAAYFMEGADLSRVRPPQCQLVGCHGPVPNDLDFQLGQEAPMAAAVDGRTCHRTFVPLNGCMEGRGYTVGMVCSICCECSAQLAREMQNSRGWTQGFNVWPESGEKQRR